MADPLNRYAQLLSRVDERIRTVERRYNDLAGRMLKRFTELEDVRAATDVLPIGLEPGDVWGVNENNEWDVISFPAGATKECKRTFTVPSVNLAKGITGGSYASGPSDDIFGGEDPDGLWLIHIHADLGTTWPDGLKVYIECSDDGPNFFGSNSVLSYDALDSSAFPHISSTFHWWPRDGDGVYLYVGWNSSTGLGTDIRIDTYAVKLGPAPTVIT